MKRADVTLIALSLIGMACAVTAQEVLPNRDAVHAKGQELKIQRDTLEAGYKQALKQCYQEFNVTSCRNQAREKYVVSHRTLRKQEVEHAAQERQIQAADARQRRAERQAEAASHAEDAQRAQQASAERAAHNAQKQTDHVPDASKRSQYDEKIEDAQRRREDAQRRAKERDKPRAAPLPAMGGTP